MEKSAATAQRIGKNRGQSSAEIDYWPRHLDRERLRARLGADKLATLRYHEAAVVSTAPMKFQLFALSCDTLFIVPLASRGEASPDMCLSLRDIVTVARVVPSTKKQRGLLLLPTSQLFRLQLRNPRSLKDTASELFFATFEPQTQLFIQLSRALRVNFQRQLLPRMPIVKSSPIRAEQRLELAGLLEALAMDIACARNDIQRTNLIDELTAAGTSCDELKYLFFEDRTQLQGSMGLAAFLVHQLSFPLCPGDGSETRISFDLSVVRVLSVMCFDVHLKSSAVGMLTLNKLVGQILARGAESYAIREKTSDESVHRHARVLREDFLDAQASLLLVFDAMQQHEDYKLYQQQRMEGSLCEKSTSVAQLMLRAPALTQWLPKFFKRICIALSRVAIALEKLQDIRGGESGNEGSGSIDSDQTLALWRSVTVLELLVHSDIVTKDSHVLSLLLRTRKDYIDMYLRASRFLEVLSVGGVPQLEDVAVKLSRFLEALQDNPKY